MPGRCRWWCRNLGMGLYSFITIYHKFHLPMPELLHQQYALLQFSRELVFDFLQTQVGDDLNTPVAHFDNKTIRYLLEHNASCHFNWLAYFALKQPHGSLKDEGFTTMPLIRQLYK